MTTSDNSFFIPGDSRGVLLIHGLTGTPTEMKYLGRSLAATGFTVYGMQLAGHCGDESDLLQTGWQDWCASIEQAHDWLSKYCDITFVAGLSMGAILALYLAVRRPDAIAGIALYSTPFWRDGWSVHFTRHLLPLAALLPKTSRMIAPERPPYGIKDERLRQMIVAHMMSGDSGAAGLTGIPVRSLFEMQRLIKWVKHQISRIRTPTLIVHALEDDISSIRSALYLERSLRGPVTMCFLDDSFHMVTVDRQRGKVAQYSREFFEKNTTLRYINTKELSCIQHKSSLLSSWNGDLPLNTGFAKSS